MQRRVLFSQAICAADGALEDGQQTSGGTPPLAAEVQPGDEHLVALVA